MIPNTPRSSGATIASFTSLLLVFGSGCGDALEGDTTPAAENVTITQSPIGNPYPWPHNLELSKRQYTWTIKVRSETSSRAVIENVVAGVSGGDVGAVGCHSGRQRANRRFFDLSK